LPCLRDSILGAENGVKAPNLLTHEEIQRIVFLLHHDQKRQSRFGSISCRLIVTAAAFVVNAPHFDAGRNVTSSITASESLKPKFPFCPAVHPIGYVGDVSIILSLPSPSPATPAAKGPLCVLRTRKPLKYGRCRRSWLMVKKQYSTLNAMVWDSEEVNRGDWF
jgi:hypothetical protein